MTPNREIESTDESHPLRDELQSVLNRHSRESMSGTPDFILAEYMLTALALQSVLNRHSRESMLTALAAFDTATRQRDAWWGHHPGGIR